MSTDILLFRWEEYGTKKKKKKAKTSKKDHQIGIDQIILKNKSFGNHDNIVCVLLDLAKTFA